MITQNSAPRQRALIAMSGGVDSSVAAYLMQQAGFDCTGVTMRLTRKEALGQSGTQTCCSEKDIEDAAEVAFALGMPYEVLDFTVDFREKIIQKFIQNSSAVGTLHAAAFHNKSKLGHDRSPFLAAPHIGRSCRCFDAFRYFRLGLFPCIVAGAF